MKNTQRDDAAIFRLFVRLGTGLLATHDFGHPLQKALGHLRDDLLGPHLARRGDPRLHREDDVQKLPRFLRLRGDLGVGVKTEDLGIFIHRQLPHVLPDLLQRALVRAGVSVQRAELVPILQHTFVEVAFQEGANEAHVLVVRHAAAVVDLCDDVVQGDPRHSSLRFQIHLHLLAAHLEIAVHPLVGHVPSDGPELPALQDRRVEEGQGVQQLLVLARLAASFIDLFSDVLEAPGEVRAQALGRLVGDLDASLQHRHRESGGGHGGEPQPVHVIDAVGLLHLLDPLQGWHPTGRQVAVLQTDPVP
mmetsp:Transcript_62941/g.150347  ORF Transcript_62941/g.150347 Transcript_62941/m.150347 type:complete len:305 (-) Transcript_62941:6203-7117(-)